MRSRSPVTIRGMSSSQPLAVHGSRRSLAGSRHQCTPGSLTASTYVEPDLVLTMTTDRMRQGTRTNSMPIIRPSRPRVNGSLTYGGGRRFMTTVDPIRFTAQVRYWNPEKGSGLAVADVPAEHIAGIGGLKQQRVRGTIGGAEFTSSVMPAGGGRLALSVSKAMMASAGAAIGDDVGFTIDGIGRD
jgi:Domain of unknown function (DUF1905)